MAYKAVEIANEFLKMPNGLGRLTQMQLQKLAYIANGFNLVINHRDLVSDTFEAWDYGPVSPDLRDHTEHFGRNPIKKLITPNDKGFLKFFNIPEKSEPYVAELTQDERALVKAVFNRYGHLSGVDLSKLTHQPGTPWHRAYNRGRNSPIVREEVIAHYNEIAAKASQAKKVA